MIKKAQIFKCSCGTVGIAIFFSEWLKTKQGPVRCNECLTGREHNEPNQFGEKFSTKSYIAPAYRVSL